MNKDRKLGDPFDPETEQGPQVDKAQFDKILHYIDIGKKEGAKCVTGGKRHGDRGLLHRADAVRRRDRTTWRSPRDEIFGPVLSRAEVQGRRRDRRTGPTTRTSAWPPPSGPATSPRPTAWPPSVRAGTVWVNCYDVFDAAAPFGGFKMSGIGRELGEEGLEAYTETKTVTVALG